MIFAFLNILNIVTILSERYAQKDQMYLQLNPTVFFNPVLKIPH